MDNLNDESITIYDAVQHIDKGKYVMPAFQRQYVWDMEKNSANKLFKILTAAVIILFGFVIVQSLLVKGSNSDMANMVLRAYDLLHGDILCRNWHEFMFYTTDLLFYDIVTLFTGISTRTVYIATFLMIILMYFAGALLIKRDGKFEATFVLLFLLLTGINI